MFFFYDKLSAYRPLINYKWHTTFDDFGNRLLKDNGTSPKYDAELYFGRGLKQNGTDQTITIHINDTINTIVYYKDDALVYDETLQTLTDYTTDVNSDSIYRNFIFYKGIFTDVQKEYLHKYPEKFLYREDGILKSKILNQSEIANVVRFLPICEIDGYVRDMVEYSEGISVIDYANIAIDNDGDGVSTLTLLQDGFEIEQDGSGSLTDKPSITIPFTNSETQASGNTYLLEYNATLISGDNNTKAQSILGENVPVNIGTNYFAYTTTEDIQNGSFTFDSTVAGKIRIDNIIVKPITGTYNIQNFTNSCRDEAKQLTTGLQTCFWNRDILGVPYSLSKGIEWTGELDNHYIHNSLAIPISDEPMSNGFVIEMVHRYRNMPDNSDRWIINNTNGYTGLRIQPARYDTYYGIDKYNVLLFLHGKDGDGNDAKLAVVAMCYKYELNHILFVYDGIDSLKMYVDGVNTYNITITLVPSGLKFSEKQSISYDFELRLFNIHTEPQDPLKLYDDAVKKGLLND